MRVTTITRRYAFEAAHFLPKVRDGHKCKRMHGHNYEIEVTVSGPLQEDGFLVDFWDLDTKVQPIIDMVDHRVLNDIPGLENPTAENIADWFMSSLSGESLGAAWGIAMVRVYETKDCWADVHASGQ